MGQSLKKETQKTRDIDPNVMQRRAADPDRSVWVSASAGTGKTKVLTDRVLRLLLPRTDGRDGAKVQQILCLTFTKAGASEMALRINDKLAKWAVIKDKNLRDELEKLLGHTPKEVDIRAARRLFADIVDTPNGLKIMTIHSFCQSILGRFPLESGLQPYFKVLDDTQTALLMTQAQKNILNKKTADHHHHYFDALQRLSIQQNEDQFQELLKSLSQERYQFYRLLKKFSSIEKIYEEICRQLKIKPGLKPDDIISKASQDKNFDKEGLLDICGILDLGSTKTDQPKGHGIQSWILMDPQERIQHYGSYKNLFLTANGEIRKSLATKSLQEKYPKIKTILDIEAARILAVEEEIKSSHCALLTSDLLHIAEATLSEYSALKERMAGLDYDDLILKTLDLLTGNSIRIDKDVTPWVRYKLDQGIDHILVDEAQDTNPEQWEIVRALCGDFFAGESATDNDRSLFVVGDEKQSIFSFQRASPEKFTDMQNFFSTKISDSSKKFDSVDLNISFRSVKAILQVVDAAFSDQNLEHISFRRGQAGIVELWPLEENDSQEDVDPWESPTIISDKKTGAVKLADKIASQIRHWLDTKEILSAYNRPIEPGDIMILLRTRNAFTQQLIHALKVRNIPVSGVDRMILNDQLVVEDMLSLASFSLLPDDDYTLSCLLKSPFIGWSDDDLFELAHDRSGSLWQKIKESDYKKEVDYLTSLIELGSVESPFSFFSTILQTACPADKISGLRAIKSRLGKEALDPLDEFLQMALSYELQEIPSLQGFVHSQQQKKVEIKRQMEEAGQAVRIMTVHASKGLQSPIVFLPDTVLTSSSKKTDKILWPDRSDMPVPFFLARIAELPILLKDAIGRIQDKSEAEYRRLLYVAMTRAEERLYISGYKGLRNPLPESWHCQVQQAFLNLPQVEKIEGGLRVSIPATQSPDHVRESKIQDQKKKKTVPWLFQQIPNEPMQPTALIPSRSNLDKDSIAVFSPASKKADKRFLRGNVTHFLLQHLPNLPVEQRRGAAQKYTAQPSLNLTQSLQESIVDEVIEILENSEFSFLFGPGSMAEVSVSGLVDDNILISGQIDRLVVSDEAVAIIDYKTNRPPPKNVADIPSIYRQQMNSYAKALEKIYPKHRIRCFLLWTDGPSIMEIL